MPLESGNERYFQAVNSYLRYFPEVTNAALHFLFTGERNDLWNKINIQVRNLPIRYRLFWEAVRGAGDTSDIAVDEITVCPGKCQK